MHLRCPACRKITLVLEEQIEHLTRCERCGILLHVRACAASGPEVGPDRTLIARPLPRTVAARAQYQPTGIFARGGPVITQEEISGMENAPSPALADSQADAVDSTLASLAQQRVAQRRPRDPLESLRRRRLKWWGFATATATTLVIAAGSVIAFKTYGVFHLASAHAVPPPSTVLTPQPAAEAASPARQKAEDSPGVREPVPVSNGELFGDRPR